MKNTLDPEWNEEHVLDNWSEGDALQFTVYDQGLLGSKIEGKAVLHSELFFPRGFNGQLSLSEGEGKLYVRVALTGSHVDPHPHAPQTGSTRAQTAAGTDPAASQLDAHRGGCRVDTHALPLPTASVRSPNAADDHLQRPHMQSARPPMRESHHNGASHGVTDRPATNVHTHGQSANHHDDHFAAKHGNQAHASVGAKYEGGPITESAEARTSGSPTRGTQARKAVMTPPSKLLVSFVHARGLQSKNRFVGDSPYCVCTVMHGTNKGSHCQTKALSKTLEPVWNEDHWLEPWSLGDSLEFIVYDKGLLNHNVEGKATLSSEDFFPHGFDGELKLDDGHSFLQVRVQPERQLAVTMVGAKGLLAKNHFVGDAPYCVCEVEHSSDRGKPRSWQTKALAHTLEPQWNEMHWVEPWAVGKSLSFVVYDKGMMGSKEEGKAILESHRFYPHGFDEEFELDDGNGKLHVRVQHPRRLTVTIIKAEGLQHLNHFASDAPYCVCQVIRDTNATQSTCKTEILKKTLEPEWNEEHLLEPWAVGESLEFVVHDHGLMGSKVAGKAQLASERFFPRGFEGVLQLVAQGDATAGRLHVRVVPSASFAEA